MEKVEQIRNLARTRRKTIASVGICLMAAFMAYHVFTAENGIKVYFHKKSENLELQKEIDQLKAENEQLTKRVNSLKSDPQAIEKEAREQLKYAKPGEVVYVSPEPPQAQPPADATAQKR
jgi:cell division protein FtsB